MTVSPGRTKAFRSGMSCRNRTSTGPSTLANGIELTLESSELSSVLSTTPLFLASPPTVRLTQSSHCCITQSTDRLGELHSFNDDVAIPLNAPCATSTNPRGAPGVTNVANKLAWPLLPLPFCFTVIVGIAFSSFHALRSCWSAPPFVNGITNTAVFHSFSWYSQYLNTYSSFKAP